MRCRLFLSTLAVIVAASGLARADELTDPPSVSFRLSAALLGPQVLTFSEPVKNISGDNLLLRRQSDGLVLGRNVVCRNGSAASDCTAGPVTSATVTPAKPFVSGQLYEMVLNPQGTSAPIVDEQAMVLPESRARLRGSIAEEESSHGVTTDWRRVAHAAASNGSYRSERSAGATATFWFNGSSVSWYMVKGPSEGLATVLVDGVARATLNSYATRLQVPIRRSISASGSGRHRLDIRVLGKPGARGGGTWVSIDGFAEAGKPQTESARYRWVGVGAAAASGDRYIRSIAAGARTHFRFRGNGIDWFTVTGPGMGLAAVYVDNRHVKTFDNYSESYRYGVRRTISGLVDTEHTLTVVTTGSRNRRATGSAVAVDRYVLRAGTTAFRKLGTWVDLWDYTTRLDSRAEIDSAVANMRSRGVRTLYLQTGRYNTAAFHRPEWTGWWLQSAHAAGIRVIGWYLPAYSEHLSGDVTKSVAISTFRSAGHAFDGLAIDIEFRRETSSKSEFFEGIATHLARVRARVGWTYPVGAITFAPLDMDIWPAGWSGFPWWAVTRYADVAMPMAYWSNRLGRCADGQTQYCAYEYTKQNVLRTRAYTGLPVHNIGGVADRITVAQTEAYVRAMKETRAFGGGLYDYRTTQTNTSLWSPLAGLNAS